MEQEQDTSAKRIRELETRVRQLEGDLRSVLQRLQVAEGDIKRMPQTVDDYLNAKLRRIY